MIICLGFYAVSTVFQLCNGDSSQIHIMIIPNNDNNDDDDDDNWFSSGSGRTKGTHLSSLSLSLSYFYTNTRTV